MSKSLNKQFGQEKLIVYQKAMNFIALKNSLIGAITRPVAAYDHLTRGAESVVVNIAYAHASWSPKKRLVYLGYANGSALECAACLDVLVAKKLLNVEKAQSGKNLLAEVVSMLIAMHKATGNRVSEEHAVYRTKSSPPLTRPLLLAPTLTRLTLTRPYSYSPHSYSPPTLSPLF